jgi:RNA 2',3'-cyclic 3'-phosphodiesterase
MPRLFTGLSVPPEIGERLARFRGGLPGARWVEAGDYHVTLRFLGDIDADVAEGVLEALAGLRARDSVPVTLEGLGAFGGDRPRALFAAVAQDPGLMDLQAEQERLVRRAGAVPETRRFTPHVTLARLRRETSPEGVAMYVAQSGLFEPLRFEARAVTVFSARESTGGGPYIAEAEFPFA